MMVQFYFRDFFQEVFIVIVWILIEVFDFLLLILIVMYFLVMKGNFFVFDVDVKMIVEDLNGYEINVDFCDDG